MIIKGIFIGVMVVIGWIVIIFLAWYINDLYDAKEANMPKSDKSLVKVELIFNNESLMWYEDPKDPYAWAHNNMIVDHIMDGIKFGIKVNQYMYVRTIAERLGIDPLQFKADLGWEKGIYDKFEYKTAADKEKQEIRITFMAAHLV